MFSHGERIDANQIDESIRETLRQTLDAEDDKLTYYFVEYDEDACVLTVESEDRFAVVHCPSYLIDPATDYSFEAEQLIDQLFREHFLDHALDTRNKALFQAVLAYRSTPEPVRPAAETPPSPLRYEGVYDMKNGHYLFGDILDYGSAEYWELYDEDEEE